MFKSILKLNTGASIPALGYCCSWQCNSSIARGQLRRALTRGYRYIDVCTHDGEVAEVVETIRLSGIPRSELFIATEVWHDISRPAFDQESLKMALERLDLDYVDLLYLTTRRASLRFSEASLNLFEHRTAEMWNLMEKLDKQKVRSIGVANFDADQLEKLAKIQTIAPAANRLTLRPPYIEQQEATIQYCQKRNILVPTRSDTSRTMHVYG